MYQRVYGFGGLTLTILILGLTPFTAQAQTWLNEEWTRRTKLTVPSEKIAEGAELSEVTLLVQLDAEALQPVFSVAKSDGSDLLVTSGDGVTVLPHELVSFDTTAETGEFWFRASSLSPTDNTFYLYFGNPDTTVVDSSDETWSQEHLAVYHFDEDPGAVTAASDSGPGDSENPAIIGSGSTWSAADLVDAQIGDGWYFDGSEDWLYASNISSQDSSFTLSAWFANVDQVDKAMLAMQVGSGFWETSFVRAVQDDNASLRTYRGEMQWTPSIPDADLHHYVWVMDAAADTALFYLDGVEQSVRTYYTRFDSVGVYIGEPIDSRVGIAGPLFSSPTDRTQGIVDEYRIKKSTTSSAQVLTEYWNQSAPAEFFAYSQEFVEPVAVADPFGPSRSIGSIAVWPNPFQYSAQIEVNLEDPTVQIRVFDIAGRLVRSLGPGQRSAGMARLQWDGRDRDGQSVSSGIYYIRADGVHASISKKVLVIR